MVFLKKYVFICSFFLISVSLLSAKNTLLEDLDLSVRFYMDTDNETAPVNYFNLGLKLKGQFEVNENWLIGSYLDVAYDKIRADELWVRYSFGRERIQLGQFENEILLEDQFSSVDTPFYRSSLTRGYLKYSGWYSKKAAGVKYYRNYNKKTLIPLSAFTHVFFSPSGREVQANLGLFYPFAGEDSWIGFSAAYYPYWIHNSWVGQSSSYAQDNNYLFQAVVADMSGRHRVMYNGNITVGSNLIDPVGIIHFPGAGEPSWFLSGDMMTAMSFGDKAFSWMPGLSAGFLIYDLNNSEAWTFSGRTGHLLSWQKDFFLHLEGGLNVITKNGIVSGSSNLQTALEWVWGVKFQVRI